MNETFTWCMFCHQDTLEPTTTTVTQGVNGVIVTIDGVPAGRCRACGEISFHGKVAIPVDDAIRTILLATGALVPPTPDEEAALRAENRELAKQLGQEDALLDEPAATPSRAV